MSPRRPRNLGVFEREYAGTTGSLRAARNDVVSWLKEHRLDEDLQERAALVLSELASNAVQASPGTAYGVSASLAADRSVVLSVTNRTERDAPPPRGEWGPATLLAARGRGLLIVGALSDRVAVERPTADTVVVTTTLRSATQG